MKIESVAARFYQHVSLFACPLCRAPLDAQPPASLSCEKGHCFNLSSRGYASFLSNAKPSKYDKTLFESRRAVFDAGFYLPVVDALSALLAQMAPPCPTIADVGCGDGYYSLQLSRRVPGTYVALDLVRDAVALGARGGNDVLWCVGDLARLPLRDGSADVLLDVLTPSNYAEFIRVLSPDGALVKVIPGADYLCQIRALLGDRLHAQPYTEDRVRDYLRAHMTLTGEQRIRYTLPLTAEQSTHFLRMTPMTMGVDTASLDATALTEITIDLLILTAMPKK